ncbi:MAG: hypothetical protein AAF420_08745, partial [Pseudomonadota bacterium]
LLVILIGSSTLFGCVHHVGGGSGTPLPDTESIAYTLPYTHAKVTATLTLKSCTPMRASANVSVVPIAAPSSLPEEQFIISGKALQSITKSRDVAVTLHENRTLKTVNATTADKTPTIIGNVIKLATLFLAPAGGGSLTCTDDVAELLDHVDTLKTKIAALREKQYDENHSGDETVAKNINALAAELARLNTGPLQVKLSSVVAIQPELKAGYITWKEHHFRKWIEDPAVHARPQLLGREVPEFKLRYCIWAQGDDEKDCTTTLADAGAAALDCRPKDITCPPGVPAYDPAAAKVDCGTCSNTLVFREPVPAKFVVVADADNYVRPVGTQLAQSRIAISQWGTAATLPMSVGFGGSKSVSITLDPFGQRTAFGWKSNSSGEVVTGALSTLGEQYIGFRDRDDGASLKEITDESTYLEAKQKLNRLEACREIIENGGYTCPE